jgi:diguanylate cyclase (GGDEF)-like protein
MQQAIARGPVAENQEWPAGRAWRLQLVDPFEALRLAEEARQRASSRGDELGRARAEVTVGVCRARWDQSAETAALLRKVATVFQNHGDRLGWLRAILGLGILQRRRGSAQACYDECLPLLVEVRRIGEPRDQVLYENLLGTASASAGCLDTGLRHYLAALEIARQAELFDCQALVLSNIGDTQHKCGDDATALEYLEKAFALTVEHRLGALMCLVVADLATTHLALGRPEKARTAIDSAIGSETAGHDRREPGSAHALSLFTAAAEVYSALGCWDQAELFLARARNSPAQVDLSRRLRFLRVSGQIALGQGSFASALGDFEQAARLLREAPSVPPFHAVAIFQALATTHAELGNWKLAYEYLSRRAQAYDQLHSSAARARVLTTRVYAELAEAERELAYLDPLTKLPNRERIRLDGDALLKSQGHSVVLALRIVGFNAINQVLGHDIGDLILIGTGRRLAAIPGVRVGHYHANQFYVVIPDGMRFQSVRTLVDKAFAEPMQVAGQAVDVALSVGVARSPDHGTEMAQLLRHADIAMHAAHANRSEWILYSTELASRRRTDLDLLSSLRHAVERDELRIYLQPKVRLRDGRVIGAEVLVRWQHPTRGLVTPGEFIPFAESTGVIGQLTRWVLRQVVRCCDGWTAADPSFHLSVNVSAHELQDPGFAARAETLLGEAGADPARIRLEVTESGVMEDPGVMLAVLRRLRSVGFSLSIDDFGTGYSSLAHLQKIPVAELKIDRSFVTGVAASGEGEVLLDSVIHLGHRLGLNVVAEGVESSAEWELLSRLGCDDAQGWLVARPMPLGEFDGWLRRHDPFLVPHPEQEGDSAGTP